MRRTVFVVAVVISLALRCEALSWQWQNQPATTNDFDLTSVDYANGQFVMVGRRVTEVPGFPVAYTSIAMLSANGTNWSEAPVGAASARLNKVVYRNGRFVAVGNGGLFAVSTNGNNWQVCSTGLTNDLYAVEFGNGMYVAVGTAGRGVCSSNLVNFQPVTVTTIDLKRLAFGNGTFVATWDDDTSVGFTSTNGVNWNLASNYLKAVCFGGGAFVGAASFFSGSTAYDTMLTSSNGGAWQFNQQITTGSGKPAVAKYFNGRFWFYSSGSKLISSLDGTNWVWWGTALTGTNPPSSATGPLQNVWDLASDGSTFVLPNAAGKYYLTASGNGLPTNFTVRYLGSTTVNSTGAVPVFRSVAEGNGVVVGMRAAGELMAVATDGVIFSTVNATNPTSRAVVRFGGGGFIAAGDNSVTVLQSTNGLQWFARNAGGAPMNNVGYGAGIWVSVGANGAVSTSPSGLVWTTRSSGTTANLKGVTYGNGRFVAVGAGGTVISSPDGLNWTVQSSSTLNQLNDVCYGNGLFVADGDAGTILTSEDGVNWTARSSGTSNNLGQIVASYGRFEIAGGILLGSADGVVWQQDNVGPNVAFNSVFVLGGKLQAVGTWGEVFITGSLRPVVTPQSAAGGCQLTFTGMAGTVTKVQYATNVSGPWQDAVTLTNVTGTLLWTDTNSTSTQRFYRAGSP